MCQLALSPAPANVSNLLKKNNFLHRLSLAGNLLLLGHRSACAHDRRPREWD